MKTRRRIRKAVIFFAIAGALFFAREYLYRMLADYRQTGTRHSAMLTQPDWKSDCDAWLQENPDAGTKDIVAFADNYTRDNLKFTFEKCTTDPNRLMALAPAERRSNCVGYSSMMDATVSYLARQSGKAAHIHSEHCVGLIFIAGFNLHRLFDHPFFRDHDYNVVVDKQSGRRFWQDPSVEEVLK